MRNPQPQFFIPSDISCDSATIATDIRFELAENPLWDGQHQCLYWTDIPAGRIHRLKYEDGQCDVVYQGLPVGGFTFQENGDLLLFRVNDIALLDSTGKATSLFNFTDTGMERFNDVIADPEGRVFAGTIGKHPQCGLYRLDLDGSITKLFDGTGCSNGMGFSPDLKTFYWTCTTTRRIFRFDYERKSGTLSNRQLFYQATPEEGLPDGLKVDAKGRVWSARWAGGTIICYDPEGKVAERLTFPATNITSLCFAGPNLSEIFVTSARDAERPTDAGGSLFHLHLNATGKPEFRSRIAS